MLLVSIVLPLEPPALDVERGIEQAIDQKRVTYDFERQMQGATKVSTSGFADAIIENMNS